MEYLLQVKVGALVALLVLTLLIGIIPARMRWFRETSGSEAHKVVLSFISCFAGGVFLAACLLDIIPDYLSDIGAALEAQELKAFLEAIFLLNNCVVNWSNVPYSRINCQRLAKSDFPVAEFIMATGFFMVLILERIVVNFGSHRGEESAPLLGPVGHGHGPPRDLEGSGHHIHVDMQAHSSFRSFILFLSLSLHSVFEGLAIGLQSTQSKVLEICLAILVHKSIIVFSLSVKLVQSAVRPVWVLAYIVVFSVMSPLGIGVGISVMAAQLESSALIQAVLEGLAAGTFIYITFLEILPHELNSPERPLLKVLFILLGFSIMVALTFLG